MSPKFRVFLSWSGASSHALADLVRSWLPNVIQAIEPWMSESDIEKGESWPERLSAELEEASLGILCLTHDSLSSAWLLFEAGALSHKVGRRHVCPLLLGLEPTDLTFPLARFQATRTTEADVLQLIKTINTALGQDALSQASLDQAFRMWWPEFASGVEAIQQGLVQPAEPLRKDRELLEETLELVRSIKMALPSPPPFRTRRARSTLVTCPSCGERKLRLGDGDPICAKCSWTTSPEVAADEYARSGNPSWKHPKHGPDDEIGTCENCDSDAVAPLHESDIVGQVRQKIVALWRALDLEPGAGDAGYGICLSCGDVHYGRPRQRESAW